MAKRKSRAGQKVSTKNELADCLGVERTTLHRHLLRPDAPAPDADGTFDVPTFRKWAKKCGFLKNGAKAPPSNKFQAELRLVELKSRSLELDVMRKEGRTMPREEHVAVLQFVGQLYRTQLEGFVKSVAAFTRDPIVIRRAEDLVRNILASTRQAIEKASA